MIRKPVVAGQFYEGSRKALLGQIEASFMHDLGPKTLPSGSRQGSILGMISPHAGYQFSAPCAANGFMKIAESEFADLYIILGPSHTGFHKSCFSEDDWETPLGLARTDSVFARLLEENSIPLIPIPHQEEHSIEVQVPLLQFACRDKEKDILFIPIIVSEMDYKETAEGLIKAVKAYESLGKKVVVIASSDFSHIGVNYGYMPFKDHVQENMYKLDTGAIDLIIALDSEGFLEYCSEHDATICGKFPIYVLIELMKAKNAKAELLQYYTSADIIGDYSNAVGYASILFR